MDAAATAAALVEEPGRPFDLAGGPDAVLLLHGLSGSPFEVRALADHLQAQGMRCLGPLLAGHGGDPAALAAVGWRDFVSGAEAELLRLEGARRTFVVGCSMGALLALALAHSHPDRVDALALLAPAMELALLPRLAGKVARWSAAARRFPPVPKGASDVRDPEMRRANPAMKAVPIAAVGELQRLAAHVDRILPAVTAPALVVAGRGDHTVTLRGVRRVVRRIGSGPARLLVLPDSWHLVGIDVERDVVADEVAAFLARAPAPRRQG
ncbi:MAG TPA: alpha/beta fold hydrolase [Anaeromyxobacteraceae bacterium]